MALLRFERVSILGWMNFLNIYALWMLMTYLTSVWGLGIARAAAIVNIYWSFRALSPTLRTTLINNMIGNFWMAIIASVSSTAGMGFLTMSTPPVLAHITGTCSEYSPKCIGQAQKVLLYTSLPLIAFGIAGCEWLSSFTHEQFGRHALVDDSISAACDWLLIHFIRYGNYVFIVVAVFGLAYVKPWSLRFGIPAMCTLVATILFFSTSCSFKFIVPTQRSYVPTFCKVLFAAVSKLFYAIPEDTDELFEIRDNPQLRLVPHSTSLRCLDKAAILIPTTPVEEQMWRLCRVTQVEEAKAMVRVIPVFFTLVLCGVVASISRTYFIEQLEHMNPKVGRLKVPTLVLIWLEFEVQRQCMTLFIRLANTIFEKRLIMYGFVGIVISMILAILCCITCGKVENRRLGSLQKPDDHQTVLPMTMFWLLPQFALLGAFRGLFDVSVVCLLTIKDSEVVMNRLQFFVDCVSAVGFLGNIMLVFVVGKISEKGGKTNWFQHDLNESRLDKYYYTLAWLMAVNLVVFLVVVALYRCNEWMLEDEHPAAAESGANVDAPDNGRAGIELQLIVYHFTVSHGQWRIQDL